MKKIIYFIPGFGGNCSDSYYQELIKSIENSGYEVVPINPDWFKPFSDQIFKPKKEGIVLGFSYGALLAYLVAQKYQFKKVIFGSITPIKEYSLKSLEKYYKKYVPLDLAIKIAKDFKSINLSFKDLQTPHVTLYGEREKMSADFLVPKTGHNLSKNYINSIIKLLP